MKTISMVAIASMIALSAAALGVTPEAAKAGPIGPPGHSCLAYDLGGTDCSFTSYAQCEATASGGGAVCYGNGDKRAPRRVGNHGDTMHDAWPTNMILR